MIRTELSLKRSTRFNRRPRSGFSLTELVAAAAILGTIAAMGLPRIVDTTTEAEKEACYVNQGDIEINVQRYYRDNGSWPATDLSNIEPPSTSEYFPEGVPVCPVDGTAYTIDANTHRVVGHNH